MNVGQTRGTHPREAPFTPGTQAAGVVESVGDGVDWVKPGDRVAYTGQPGARCNGKEREVDLASGVRQATRFLFPSRLSAPPPHRPAPPA